ncbi:SDR family NAD(P)-dependent oxidoreductase [Bombilactobacillus folatiphilus]|uniref:SDR family NAD(P)-dependent oxidoreductase n=1 Tax=Bombilactobacillus folatiphilus TaxID=2923362 RepID=A0ABY4P871_9LACO|nr:SDR family NAD(P)-dependent oxidoreductase [Bombilactobacillus folatiphilus]UQS81913.1 SDR family NAD(P)-dependent oxidoreductase [Bombilactobacillus folatiphilus]
MNKYVMITGASSGIGLATAKKMVSRGKNLILVARRKDKLLNLKDELKSSYPEIDAVIKTFDLTKTDAINSFWESLSNYDIETLINNAGMGMYSLIKDQNDERTQSLLKLDVEALALLTTLFVKDYWNVEGTQVINISSAGGYEIVPNAITYCASKFFVSAFTEGLALELKETGAKMRAKVLAPAATKTEFGKVANNVEDYDYDQAFPQYHTAEQVASFLMDLYDHDSILGFINRDNFEFEKKNNYFENAYGKGTNQTLK